MPFKMLSPLDIALGKIGKNSHPLHPAFVHYPLTFLLTASLLDITSFYISFSSSNPDHPITIVPKVFPLPHISVLNSMSLMSYYSTVAAVLTSIPALITGGSEAYNLFFGGGLDSGDPMVKMTLVHAWLNYAAVGGAVYNWLTRRGVEGYGVSGGKNVIVSGFIVGAVGYAAFLGGTLVYARGVGVQRMGEGLEFKQRKEREVKGKDVKGEKEL